MTPKQRALQAMLSAFDGVSDRLTRDVMRARLLAVSRMHDLATFQQIADVANAASRSALEAI